MNESCISCGKEHLDKNTIGINKKLINANQGNFYCLDCLAELLDTSVEDLLAKIEDFKDDGCELFE